MLKSISERKSKVVKEGAVLVSTINLLRMRIYFRIACLGLSIK